MQSFSHSFDGNEWWGEWWKGKGIHFEGLCLAIVCRNGEDVNFWINSQRERTMPNARQEASLTQIRRLLARWDQGKSDEIEYQMCLCEIMNWI